MPYTIYGIGTMYFGKRNREVYEGLCENCGRTGRLRTYGTRLWLVILFTPFIPLERKQIIDFCPSCKFHRAVPLEEWCRLKEQYPGANADIQPHRPDKSNGSAEAIDRHLDLFQEGAEAKSMARKMSIKFAGSLDVQLYLASYYLRREKEKEAQKSLERILLLDPGNRWARRHVGIDCLRKGNLPRARQLLSYLRKSHTPGDAGAILELAAALWEAARYPDAYAYFEIIARDFKSVASKNSNYRRMVKDIERRSASSRSILPPSIVVKRLAATGIVVIALLGILYAVQDAAKQRTLHVVNGLNVKAVFSIPGKKPLEVRPMDRSTIILKEGEYRASVKIKDWPGKTVKFTLSDGFWERLFDPSLFVFNIEGAAVIIWQKVHYSWKPRTEDPYEYRLYVGDPLVKIKKKDVNYLFTALPKVITLHSGNAEDRTRLGILKDKPESLVGQLVAAVIPPNSTMAFLESHLDVNREREKLLNTYTLVGEFYLNPNRCIAFLEKGLSQRPVLVDWHHFYQDLRKEKGEAEQLYSLYDRLLENEPGNSELLYLRGRLAKNTKEAFTYYDKAIAADPKNPFPYFAKALYLSCRGDFVRAWEMSGKACALHPGEHSMKDAHDELRFAVNELESYELKMKSRLDGDSTSWDAFEKLMEVQVAQKKIADAKKTLEEYRKALRKEYKESAFSSEMKAQLVLDYLLKDFDAMEKHQAGLDDEAARSDYLITVYLNRGEMEKLEALPDIPEDSNGYQALLYWLGWLEKGNPGKASTWLAKAREYFLAMTDFESKQVGRWLEKPEPGITTRLDELQITPRVKRILYIAFSRLYFPERGQLLARAKKMNYLPQYPYHFIKKLTNN